MFSTSASSSDEGTVLFDTPAGEAGGPENDPVRCCDLGCCCNSDIRKWFIGRCCAFFDSGDCVRRHRRCRTAALCAGANTLRSKLSNESAYRHPCLSTVAALRISQVFDFESERSTIQSALHSDPANAASLSRSGHGDIDGWRTHPAPAASGVTRYCQPPRARTVWHTEVSDRIGFVPSVGLSVGDQVSPRRRCRSRICTRRIATVL